MLALFPVACSQDPSPPSTQSFAVKSQLSLRLAGETDIVLNGTHSLRIATLQGEGYEEIALLSVGLDEPSPLSDGRMIRAAIDIVGYSGDGDYEIGGPVTEDALPVRSAFFVEVFNPGTAEGYARFDEASVPCQVSVTDDGKRGELSCEELKGQVGKVQVDMAWGPEA